jgi:hypothetical protein
MRSLPLVSIVIVSWNTSNLIENCLYSIFWHAASEGISIEVIVVDNASEDGTIELIKHRFPNVALIENKKNYGFGYASNQGIKKARAKYVLLLNSDTELQEGTLSRCITIMRTNPKCAIIGVCLYNEAGEIQNSYFYFHSLKNDFLRLFGLRSLFGIFKKHKLKIPFQVDVVVGAFMFCRKDVLQKVGLFDEKIFLYGEDMDLCYRVNKEGWLILYDPVAKCMHSHGASGNECFSFLEKFEHYFAAIRYFYLKHHGNYRYLLYLLLVMISFLPRFLIRSLLSLLINREYTRKNIVDIIYIKCAFRDIFSWKTFINIYK